MKWDSRTIRNAAAAAAVMLVVTACGGDSSSAPAPAPITGPQQPSDTSTSEPEAWPTRTLRWVMTAPPGGGQDGISRPIQPYLEDALGVSVVIDNRPGGDFTVGATIVAREGDDCETIMTHVDPMIHMGMILRDVSYDESTFYPIVGLTEDPMVLLARKDAPWDTAAELVAFARENPKAVQFGTALGADPALFATYQLQDQLGGVELNLIPYPGGGPARNALVSGEIDVMMTYLYTALPVRDSTKILGLNQLSGLSADENPWESGEVTTLNSQLGTNLDPYSLGFSVWATTGCKENHPARFDTLVEAFREVTSRAEWLADMDRLGQTPALQIREPDEHWAWSLQQRRNIEPLIEEFGDQ